MAKQSLSQIFGNGTQGLSKNKQTLSQIFNFSPTEPRKEETIDYAKVDELLKAHREVAKEYLRSNLEG